MKKFHLSYLLLIAISAPSMADTLTTPSNNVIIGNNANAKNSDTSVSIGYGAHSQGGASMAEAIKQQRLVTQQLPSASALKQMAINQHLLDLTPALMVIVHHLLVLDLSLKGFKQRHLAQHHML